MSWYGNGVRAWRSLLMVVVVAACHGRSEPSPQPEPGTPAPAPGPLSALPPAPPPPVFPESTRSLELVRTVGVRLEPADDAKRIGTVAVDTRVAWSSTRAGKGCEKPWVELVPQGWICGDYVKPSTKPPFGQEVPQLDRGEIVPGTYGKVTAQGAVMYALVKPETKRDKKKPKHGSGAVRSPADLPAPVGDPKLPHMVEADPIVGSLNVRQYEELTVDDKLYWKVAQKDNQYVLASAISKHQPSHYTGARLGDDTGLATPIAFVWPRAGMLAAWTTAKPAGGGVVHQLVARTLVPVLETAAGKDGKPIAYRIGDAEWMAPADVRVFAAAAPPPTLAPNERWIDVDLDSQILVAFEGDVAVYATMVSSGGKDTPTETGLYRMWLKESEADMKGLNGEDPYSVATVPWTQFFSPEKGLALHTAYWHDQFGHARSHGCVNLAPRDARWLYFWSDPQVPPGWTMAAGVVESPGSIVRIRSAVDPTPEWKGYAKKVAEARTPATAN